MGPGLYESEPWNGLQLQQQPLMAVDAVLFRLKLDTIPHVYDHWRLLNHKVCWTGCVLLCVQAPATCLLLCVLVFAPVCYSYWGHDVVKVRVGLPVEHDTAYTGPVCWR